MLNRMRKEKRREKNVLLVNAAVESPRRTPHATKGPPLGLAYIASTLMANGFGVEAVDMNLPLSDPERLRKEILREKPLVLGISASTPTLPNALRIASLAKTVDPTIKVVLGGPHVTFLSADAMRHGAVDIVVRGEGELTMLEIANHLTKGRPPLEKIRGITFRKKGKIVSNEDRPLIRKLDSLPPPARQLFPLSLYPYPGTILTSRGCPGRCIFCSVPMMAQYLYRTRSPRSVVEELISLHEMLHTRHFVFVDDTFTLSNARVAGMLELITESGLDISWECSTRADTVTRDLLGKMAKSGCVEVQYGVESGSQRVLDEIGKGITLRQAEGAVRWTKEVGMSALCYFMVPHPSDDVETINETRRFIERLTKLGAEVSLSFTVPYPGTYLYEERTSLGLKIETDDWSDFDATKPVFSTRNLPIEEIRALYSGLAAI